MVRKLCVRSLQRGIGSVDYIHGLLIAEDDDDDDDDCDRETDGVDSTAIASGASVETSIAAAPPAQDPEPGSSSTTSLPWCKCNVCVVMSQEIENKCCGQRRCVTSFARFTKLCVDPDRCSTTLYQKSGRYT